MSGYTSTATGLPEKGEIVVVYYEGECELLQSMRYGHQPTLVSVAGGLPPRSSELNGVRSVLRFHISHEHGNCDMGR